MPRHAIHKNGFTMLELMISSAILTIISFLCFVALKGSSESAALAQAKAEVQANLRDTLSELTQEIREAYTERTVDAGNGTPIAPEDTVAIAVSDEGKRVTFQVPVPTGDQDVVTVSTPIVIEWRDEDANNNGKRDANEEDTDEDGTLTRRLVRIQNGEETVLGGSNNISGCVMQLLPSVNANSPYDTLFNIRLEASKTYGLNDHIVNAETECGINLVN